MAKCYNLRMYSRKIGLLSIFMWLACASLASAASVSSVEVSLAPENPAPYENTTISLSSYANNLDSVMIAWFVNEKPALSGVGQKTFSLNAPAAGAQTTVRVRIALPEGALETRVVIKPDTMALLWQATDSYVPPFYKGKALPTLDSEIKVVAIPDVKGVSPKNMIYDWQKDYTNDQSASGYGKYSYTYINDYLENSNTISVVASTTNGASSESSIDVGTVEPEITFYRKDADLGTVWENSLPDGYRVNGEEILVAIPYFISPANLSSPSLLWSWFINGNQITVQGKKNLLPVKVAPGTSGTSRVKLQIDNSNRIYQTATKEINLNF